MARTPEQIEADTRVAAAVEEATRAYGVLPADGYHVADFVVLVEAVKWDVEDNTAFDEFHYVLYMDGSTRSTVGIGLCRVGEQMIGAGVTTSGGTDLDDLGEDL